MYSFTWTSWRFVQVSVGTSDRSGREGNTRFLQLQTWEVLSKAERGFTVKVSVTNKVTQRKQELSESSVFHKIVFSFFTFIAVTSREPCCAGFSSEGGRELQYFPFSAAVASKSPLRAQSSALIAVPHSWRRVDNGVPFRSYKWSPSGSQRQTCPMSDSGKLNSAAPIISCNFAPYKVTATLLKQASASQKSLQ